MSKQCLLNRLAAIVLYMFHSSASLSSPAAPASQLAHECLPLRAPPPPLSVGAGAQKCLKNIPAVHPPSVLRDFLLGSPLPLDALHPPAHVFVYPWEEKKNWGLGQEANVKHLGIYVCVRGGGGVTC